MVNKKIVQLRHKLKKTHSKAKLIVIEGADRRGKQTQTNMLVSSLRMHGFRVATLEVPVAGGLTYKLIYWMLSNGLAKSLPHIFQFVQFLNRLVFQTFSLKRMLMNNDYVVFDRWSLSGMIYGTVDGVKPWFSDVLYKSLVKPDITILIDGKMLAKPDDVYESDNAFQEAVVNAYRAWFATTTEPMFCISNENASKIQMHRQLMQKLREANLL